MKIKIDRVQLNVPRAALRQQRGEDLARSVAEGVAGVLSASEGGRPSLSLDAMHVKVAGARTENCADAIRAAIHAQVTKAMRER